MCLNVQISKRLRKELDNIVFIIYFYFIPLQRFQIEINEKCKSNIFVIIV